MQTSTFDLCLLISAGDGNSFRMVGMQTDDTLILVILAFLAAEEEKIQKADIRCEPKITLSPTQSLDFNGTKLTVDDGHVITAQQKGQGQKISTINPKATGYAQA